MKKFLLTALFLLMAMGAAPLGFAHTHLEESNPENGETVTEDLKEIKLNFGEKVEQGSTLKVLDSEGHKVPIDEVDVEETELIGTLSNELPNGSYQVVWNIISADGHQMDGEIPFTVNVPSESEGTDGTNEQDELIMDRTGDEDAAVSEDKADAEDDSTSYVVPIVIGILIVIILVIFFGLRRKKN